MPPLLIVLIALAIIFDFLNGVHDSSNIVATMISSRAIRPQVALFMTAIAEFSGPFIFGVAVANTIGHEIVASENLNMVVIIAALLSAIIWNIMTWLLGIPSSSSHALIGGIVGAVAIGAGFQEIHMAGVLKVLLTLFISPIVGFVAGVIIANITYAASWKASPKINGVFKKLQIVTSLGLALS
ncbi:MAG: anion permease, partial [Chloroflexi bacterium HGW-Chloroflexi-7]